MFNELKISLKQKELDGFLVTSPNNIFYLTGYDGFSYEEREAVALITKTHNFLLTDKRYLYELRDLKDFKLIEISASIPFSKALQNLAVENNLLFAGFEEKNLSFAEYKKFREIFKKFIPSSGIIEPLREIKKIHEIKNVKKACKISDLGFDYILKQLKKNVSEIEIADKLEIFFKENGADTAFKPIIAFGKNSAVPHHLNSNRKLKIGDVVLLDFGAKVNGYCSDMTRTVFFGKPNPKLSEIYKTVLNAQKAAVNTIRKFLILNYKSGIKADYIDKVSRNYIISEGFFSIPHSLGHGIGLEVHEPPYLSPNSKSLLKSGMIFSIEPGIYMGGFGGVRIEDLFLIKDNRLEKITHSTSGIIRL